jgi:hypothetical protein
MSVPRTLLAALALLGAPAPASRALAQMVGVPVLQGAFPRRGLALALNTGSADDGTAFGGALAFGIGGDRLLVTAGAGTFSTPAGYASPAFTYGTRAAFRVMTLAGGRLALTPFGGFGRVELKREPPVAGQDTKVAEARAPVGVSVGFRAALGGRGTLAFFGAPMYAFSRSGGDTTSKSDGFVRVATGVEYGLATGFGAIGVTAGLEFGQSAPDDRFGPRGTAFGLGVGLARGRR